MKLITPRLEIFPERIEQNARSIVTSCHNAGIQVAGVTKVVCAHPDVVAALVRSAVDMLADSRLENLKAMREMHISLPLMLLRIPAPDRINDVVNYSDISLNSSAETIRLLSDAARSLKTTHKVILMVDLGDLREGVWPDKLESLVLQTSKTAQY